MKDKFLWSEPSRRMKLFAIASDLPTWHLTELLKFHVVYIEETFIHHLIGIDG